MHENAWGITESPWTSWKSQRKSLKTDEESKKIIDKCYKTATDLLNKNIEKLHAMAKALVEFETLNTDQIDDIMAGAKPRSGESDDSGTKTTRKKSNPSISDPANQT